MRSNSLEENKFPSLYFKAWNGNAARDSLDWGVDVVWHAPWQQDGPFAIELRGPAATAFLPTESGIHCESLSNRGFQAWTVLGLPLDPSQSIPEVWEAQVACREQWLNQLQFDSTLVDRDPRRTSIVVRTFESDEIALDFRTSQISGSGEFDAFLKSVIPDALSLPEILLRPLT